MSILKMACLGRAPTINVLAAGALELKAAVP